MNRLCNGGVLIPVLPPSQRAELAASAALFSRRGLQQRARGRPGRFLSKLQPPGQRFKSRPFRSCLRALWPLRYSGCVE